MRSADGPKNGGKKDAKKQRKKNNKVRKPWGWKIYSLFVALGMAVAVVLFVVFLGAFMNLTPINPNVFKTTPPTVVYDGNNKSYMTIIPPNAATNLPYNKMPKNLVNAFVAIEDHYYWTGSAIDIRGIFRAAFYDLWSGNRSQGASTIQDELAKIVYLNDNKTFSYKLKEMALGVQINRYYTKQEILQMYLNRVFLGENSVGVEEAAERYFGVDLAKGQKLTLAQDALLAGLPQAPTGYDPLLHPHAAKIRRNEVLQAMANYGFVTKKAAAAAEKQPIGASAHSITSTGWDQHPLFTNFLLDEAQKLGISAQEVLQGGLQIYTTISPKVQHAVHEVFYTNNYASSFPAPINGKGVDAAGIFIDPQTGGVLGAAGSRGVDYAQGGTDRVFSYSEPGSSIKPVLEYGAAIASGKWNEASILDNKVHDFGGGYTPQNDAPGEPTSVSLQYALEQSQNVASVWLLQQLGIPPAVTFAENLGLQFTAADKQSLAIGIGGMSYGVTPWQMAQAYSAFDNGGVLEQEHLITRIVNANGKTIYSYTPTSKTVMTPQVANTMTQLMEDVVKYGTGTNAAIPGWGTAGKTGTVQYNVGLVNSDPNWISRAWWDGYTPNMVGSVYIGYDDPHNPVYHLNWIDMPNQNCEYIWKDVFNLSEQGITPMQFSIGPSPSATPAKPQKTNKPTKPATGTAGKGATSSSTAVASDLTSSWDPVGNGVFLSWVNNSGSPTNFVISRSQSPSTQTGTGSQGTASSQQVGTTSNVTYEDTTVQPGTTYTYSVQAVDPATNAPMGSPVTTTITTPGTPPSTNTTGNVTGNSAGNATGNLPGNTVGNGTSNNAGNTVSNGVGNGVGNTPSNVVGNNTGNAPGNTFGNNTGTTSSNTPGNAPSNVPANTISNGAGSGNGVTNSPGNKLGNRVGSTSGNTGANSGTGSQSTPGKKTGNTSGRTPPKAPGNTSGGTTPKQPGNTSNGTPPKPPGGPGKNSSGKSGLGLGSNTLENSPTNTVGTVTNKVDNTTSGSTAPGSTTGNAGTGTSNFGNGNTGAIVGTNNSLGNNTSSITTGNSTSNQTTSNQSGGQTAPTQAF